MPTDPRVAVVVAERRALLGELLARSLDPDAHVLLGTACDASRLEPLVGEASVVMLGRDLAPAAHLERVVLRLLTREVRTLVVGTAQVHDTDMLLLAAGASGLVLVDEETTSGIRAAVTAVAAGRSALHPNVVSAVMRRWRDQRAEGTEIALTAREQEILIAMSEGLTTRQVGNRLRVAEKTVEAHKAKLYAKLGVSNQAGAVSVGLRRGLVPQPSTAAV